MLLWTHTGLKEKEGGRRPHIKLLGERAHPACRTFLAGGRMDLSASCGNCSHRALLCSSWDATLRGKAKEIRVNPSSSFAQAIMTSQIQLALLSWSHAERAEMYTDGGVGWGLQNLVSYRPCQRQTLCSQVTAATGAGVNWKKEIMKPQKNNREKMTPFLARVLLRKQGPPTFAAETT